MYLQPILREGKYHLRGSNIYLRVSPSNPHLARSPDYITLLLQTLMLLLLQQTFKLYCIIIVAYLH